MIEFLPSEIVYNILSFLTYDQVYSMRGVCKKLGMVAEYHIYHQIKHSNQTIALKLDDNKHASLRLIANSYDPKNRVIEFVPESHCSVSLANESLDPQDHALFLYHHSYNSSLEKVYELPCWNTTHKPRRYIGDRGLIISMAYQQSSPKLLQPAHTLHSLPVSSYPASSVAVSSTPCLEIQWVRVTLDWVVSGLKCTVPTTTQIYENSFIRLNQMLADQGYFKYDPFSEPVIDYIVRQQENNNSLLATGELPHTLISYIHSHTHECRTRLSRLQHMLEGSGIDAQVLWKYTFAKSFVIGNGSLLGEEDVVRRIQDAEEEWRQKKPAFLRRLVR